MSFWPKNSCNRTFGLRLWLKAANGYASIIIYLDVMSLQLKFSGNLNFERLLNLRWRSAFIRVPLDQLVGKRKHSQR
jgi:hypothetical protein